MADLFNTVSQPTKQKIISGATFSDCGNYRYRLWRFWDDSPKIMFIGLNPSTANADTDDPTIRRVVRFAQDWGYGGVYMMNLFAWVSAYPKDLLTCDDPLGDNDWHLRDVAALCDNNICFAWGAFKQNKERAKLVVMMFPRAVCLGITADGSPKHPLYVPAKTSQVNFQ